MINLIAIYIGGTLTIMMAIFHSRFYKLFKWKSEYEKIGLPNNKIFYTIHIALILIFLMIGFISIFYAKELSRCDGLSFGFCISFSLFWLWRSIWQIVYFKGKILHIILIITFSLLFLSYLIPVIIKLI